jgi:tetratricopeptide (TPR) repeat protein
MQSDKFEFYDHSALLYRLSDALRSRPQEVVFLLGSPLSAPLSEGKPGVPAVSEIIGLIKHEFRNNEDQLAHLQRELDSTENQYQSAFRFLIGRKGQDVANEIVQKAVLRARNPTIDHSDIKCCLSDDECRALEADHDGWHLNPGLTSIGKLVSLYPTVFGSALLTTNFDPCIQQAIQRASGQSYRTTLHGDANLNQTAAEGCHVVHLHGYWWGTDTLHTSRQLTQERPRLAASLSDLLRHKLLVACGYGGWDDVFTRTLFDIVRDDSAAPEVLWLFHTHNPVIIPSLAQHLEAGIDRARISLYSDVDCNTFFPRLLASWERSSVPAATPTVSRSNPVSISPQLQASISQQLDRNRTIEGDTEDRPPQFSLCVGREGELSSLSASLSRVIFISGIGGQGKSTLAAQYYENHRMQHPEHLLVWRDCKEVGENFENQVISAIEGLTRGQLSGTDLSHQTIDSLLDVLLNLITTHPVLFVFDNVDNYISTEDGSLTSTVDLLVRKMLATPSNSQLVFTCRPTVKYGHDQFLDIHLEGLPLEATKKLFAFRGAGSTEDEIKKAQEFTKGHSLWLDLLAIQTARLSPARTLASLIGEIGQLPENMLQSIWLRLRDIERLALQALAETLKPSSEVEVADYLEDRQLNYNRVSKALRSLKAQNLVVVKELPNQASALELHPLIRHFVRNTFDLAERRSFMSAINRVYKRTIARLLELLDGEAPLSVLQNWTQKAELDIALGYPEDACATLAEASRAFTTTAFSREFSRAARLLLDSVNWVREHQRLVNFDLMFAAHIKTLSYLGDVSEIDDLLKHFAITVEQGTPRYIVYCDLMCFSHWIRKDFASAAAWGGVGAELLDKTTAQVIGEIRHNYALSQRDSGNPASALEYFLNGRALSEVMNPDELDEERGGAHYGNIGRCLHFMGQTKGALTCYQKSALLLEKRSGRLEVLNRGYARWWIGELLLARGQKRLASAFIEAGRRGWEGLAPALSRQLADLQSKLSDSLIPMSQSDQELEAICRGWILGEYLDDIRVE